jgi:trimethylamine--corrinoid protein Co-methyltransferase
MHANYSQFNSPQFRILSDRQIEELHLASLQILERTGVAFDCQKAIDILRAAGADVSNTQRVKIPSYLVEQALRTAPKTITLYTREGEPAIVLNGIRSYFGGINSTELYLDPYLKQRRPCYVEDIADMTRVIDALPNIDWLINVTSHPTLPGPVADKVALLQSILNTSKPVSCCSNDVTSLDEMVAVCSMVAGGEKELQAKPFFISTSEPVSPLMQGKEAMEKSLFCAEKGIPNFVFSAPLAGATTPATFPAVLALANAEFLSHLVVIQLKKPGAPVIYGSHPTIMDMKTTIFSYGAPESAFLIAAITELGHYYKLPVFGTAGEVDTDIIDAQAAVETTYQILLSALSGADIIHGVGEMYHGRMMSPELVILGSEIIDMVKVSMNGIEINDETLPFDLIERVGPRGTYISEKHTLKHFSKFWVPTLFDRSVVKDESTKRCEDLLSKRTIEILESHQPKPLPEDIVKELKKVEKAWFDSIDLKHEYPRREDDT